MRKIAAFLICAVMFLCFALPCLAANEDAYTGIEIYVDGERVQLDKDPVSDNGRVLVPVRAVAEKAKVRVDWDEKKSRATLKYSSKKVHLTVGSDIMTEEDSVTGNQTRINLDTAPRLVDGSVYITLRAAMESVGAGVLWDGERGAVYIVSPDSMVNYRLDKKTLEESFDGYAQYVRKKYGDRDGKYEVDTETGNSGNENSQEDTDKPPENNIPSPPVVNTKKASEYGLSFTGFRKMENDSIKENEIFNISGKVRSQEPIVLVRCSVIGTDIDEYKEYSAGEDKTTVDIYSVFNKKVKLNKAGLGTHTFTVSACVESGQEVVVFSYNYTVTEKSQGHISPNPDGNIKDDDEDEDEEEWDEETPALSYNGFRTMKSNKIEEGAPHGLYGTIRSNTPITKVRCMIVGTDMDYNIKLSEINNITEYNVFTYFDKLIRFSDAGIGKHTFRVYAKAMGTRETLLFSYTYTVTKKNSGTDDEKKPDREKVDVTSPEFSGDVCLPLKGNIRLTSPYGFRAYNKWEFHKGIDIVSDSSRDIVCVADGVVVDCATGINSGAGNYVAIQHDQGWVSLYYHLKSYNVEIGDEVEMGEVIATMGNTGGNYGVHLHFMTCDDWYGALWATQNNHHTAPHEYVPKILTEVKNYTPNFEEQNKDKIILCNFHFPHILKEGTAYSISKTEGFVATEKGAVSITVTVTDKKGKIVIEETEEAPECTTDGYYTYTNISVELDMKCHFDKLPPGEYVFYISGKTKEGRERILYTKAFRVTEED